MKLTNMQVKALASEIYNELNAPIIGAVKTQNDQIDEDNAKLTLSWNKYRLQLETDLIKRMKKDFPILNFGNIYDKPFHINNLNFRAMIIKKMEAHGEFINPTSVNKDKIANLIILESIKSSDLNTLIENVKAKL